MLMYFQGYLMDTDLMERTLPLPFRLAQVDRLKLMSVQVLPKGQEKKFLSLCLKGFSIMGHNHEELLTRRCMQFLTHT